MPTISRSTTKLESALDTMIAERERVARVQALDEAMAAIQKELGEATGQRRIGLGRARKAIARLKHPRPEPEASKEPTDLLAPQSWAPNAYA